MVEALSDEQKLQRKQRIKAALRNLKTILTDKKLTIDSNKFKLLLFGRTDISDLHESIQIIPSKDDGQDEARCLKMKKDKTIITLEQLQASVGQPVDNTGNVREWPSEEILAFYLIEKAMQDDTSQLDLSQKRRVIELGAGKSGLVGLAVATFLNFK